MPQGEVALETADASAFVEDPSGVRHYLLCLGIDVPGDTRRGPAKCRHSCWRPFASSCRASCFTAGCGSRVRHLPTRRQWAGSNPAGSVDLPRRLWLLVLGRAARSVWNRRSCAGDHPGVYHAAGDHLSAHSAAYGSARIGSAGGPVRRGRSDVPFVLVRRGSHQSCRRSRSAGCVIYLVGGHDPHSPAHSSGFEADERSRSNAYRRSSTVRARRSFG